MNFVWIVCSILVLRKHFISAFDDAPDFSEGCPRDSTLIGETCKCNHTICKKPPCMSVLKIVTEATNSPGNCCPTYSCDGCKKEEKIEGECPCLPEAIIKSGSQCMCIDPYKNLLNNTCVCDEGKCELPDLCDERSVSVKEMEGCCERIKCIPCPDDSYVTSYNDFALDDKCVCFPCPVTKCNETQTPQIMRRGKNMPGMCCDFYKCANVDPNMGCMVNGTLYSSGETWSSGDNICICQQNGISYCSLYSPTSEGYVLRPCLVGGKVYNHLDTWLEEDTCTNCTCNNGVPKCIAYMCDIHTSEMKKSSTVCPAMFTCHEICEHGFMINKLGCEICMCNKEEHDEFSYDQYKLLMKLLKEYNLTESHLIDFIKTLGHSGSLTDVTSGIVTSIPTATDAGVSPSTTTPRPTGPSTPVCTTRHNTLGDCAYSCLLEFALPGFVIGTILGTIVVLTFRKCLQKNRQKYTMYMPVGKDSTVDKNLTLTAIIKQNTKNFELQSYNEKKNVI